MSAPTSIRRRGTWTSDHQAQVAGVTVVPAAEPMPATPVRDANRATKVLFIIATVWTALFLSTAAVLLGAAVLR